MDHQPAPVPYLVREIAKTGRDESLNASLGSERFGSAGRQLAAA